MGTLQSCPLCQGPLGGEADPAGDVYPDIPLSYKQNRLLRLLFLSAVTVVAACIRFSDSS